MKKLIKTANLVSFGVSVAFIFLAIYIIYIQNKMIKDKVRIEPVQSEGFKTVIGHQAKEIKAVKYYNLQLELENTIYKQQIEESKHTLNNYRKYVIESIKVKRASYIVK